MTHQIENMKQHKIIISGGGSGGHIFPAIAIAKSLLELEKNIDGSLSIKKLIVD